MKRNALWVILVMLPWQASGSVLDTFGFGARAMGMGSAHTAIASDTSANYYNPGALTRQPHVEISGGYLMTFTSLRINERDLGVDEVNGSMLGLNVPGEIGPIRAAMGLAFYMPDDRISRVRALPESQPRFVLFDNRNQHVEIRANLAIRPIKSFSIGAGLAFLTGTKGVVTIDGSLTNIPEEAQLETSVDVTFETARFPVAGLLWEPSDTWDLGLTYRGQSLVELDIAAHVDAQITGLLGAQALDGTLEVGSFNTNFFSPHQIFFGLGWVSPWRTLFAIDLGWLHWSAFPTPTAKVDIDVQIPPLETDTLLPAPATPLSPGFQDIVVIKTGLEHSFVHSPGLSFVLRTGYGFEPSPTPAQTGLTNFMDADKHMVTAGVGVGLFANPHQGEEHPLQLDISTQMLLLEPTQTQKDSPADPIGDMEVSGEVWTLMIQAKGRFPW